MQLEDLISNFENVIDWAKRHDDDAGFVFIDYLQAALDLLKAQEPVKPKMMKFVDEGLTWKEYEVPTCGVCGALLGDALFCPMCGKKVKWE